MTRKTSDQQIGLLGIIGGTGLYHIEGLKITNQIEVFTPFGAPSAPLTVGKFGEQEVVFLPRHGLNHQIMPSEVNFCANIYALKNAGVTRIISISAVGSLQSELPMGDFAIPSQYFDWTKGLRKHTFFGEGMIAHVSTAEPACAHLAGIIKSAGEKHGIHIHTGVTYACVEGPRLGTRAESNYLKNILKMLWGVMSWGCPIFPKLFWRKKHNFVMQPLPLSPTTIAGWMIPHSMCLWHRYLKPMIKVFKR